MRRFLWIILVVLALVLAACGGSSEPAAEPTTAAEQAPSVEQPTAEEPTATPAAAAQAEAPAAAGMVELPAVNPLEVSGDIILAGSSTVFPLAEALAERFIDEGYGGNITIDSIGTGAGFERFCTAGETDISNASRAIREAEVENCGAIGRSPVELRVGTDALAVVVNPENDWIGAEGVTLEELARLFSSEVTNWSDVRPEWPAEPVKRFSPGTDSGTFDYFVEAVMNPVYVVDAEADAGKGEEQVLSAANLQLAEDDNVLVQGVAGDKNAIGYFGYAYYQANQGALTDIAIEGIAPTAESVDAGEYPLARPLFMYSDPAVMTSKPQVAAYLNFVLANVNTVIGDVGYFPASDEALDAARSAWLQAAGMESVAMPEAPAAAGMVELPAVNPLEVSGDIIVAGSSTVFPLAEALAERFIDEGYGGNITIDSIGTGAGFERFCTAGETDISNASRAIREAEVENCGAIGRSPVELRVGTDALAVVVNPENDWIGAEGVTLEELARLFSSEVTNWSDVRPEWPAEPVKRFSPGTDSGTFDYFVEAVMNPVYVVDAEADAGKGEEQVLSAANLQLAEDDNVLVQGVAGDKNAIGYFGYAYYQANQGALTDIAIEGIAPTAESVDAGEYPLARPLFMYSDPAVMTSKPQVAAYLNFVLANVNTVIGDVGYFPASDEALDAARSAWLQAVGQ